MTIGTALIIIAILYLIDKHNLWKRVAAVCLITLAVALVGFAGYYGWHTFQERKARVKAEAQLESQWQVVSEEPNWNMLPPPKGYTIDSDAAYVILYPVNADQNTKTGVWKWYQDLACISIGGSTSRMGIAHMPAVVGGSIFGLDSYDPRWMSDIGLPQEVKRALWNAKVAECRLQAGAKGVKACLDRATGEIDDGPWVKYATSCGPKREILYLNSGDKGRND
jgi:hypothetical protein